MLYFAYGSNMSQKRIGHRCPSAVSQGTFILQNYQLRFNKSGQDGSSKCNVMPTADHQVLGVVYDIHPNDIGALDEAESLGVAYRKENITVYNPDGKALDVFIYIAIETKPDSNPYCWYKTHVVKGAEEAGFETRYTDAIRQVIAVEDPNRERQTMEMAIYKP